MKQSGSGDLFPGSQSRSRNKQAVLQAMDRSVKGDSHYQYLFRVIGDRLRNTSGKKILLRIFDSRSGVVDFYGLLLHPESNWTQVVSEIPLQKAPERAQSNIYIVAVPMLSIDALRDGMLVRDGLKAVERYGYMSEGHSVDLDCLKPLAHIESFMQHYL